MKKKLLLIITLLFTSASFAQNCNFTYSLAGALNVYSFAQPNAPLPSPPYFYSWQFGDGGTSVDTAPVHAYNSFGAFNVCLYIYDSSQALVCSSCDSIYVGNPGGGGSCSFSATVDTNNLAVFIASPSSGSSVINWDFGNGASATGANVTYTYPLQGVYTVCMTEVDNFTGTIICTSCSTIVAGHTGPGGNCSFTASVDSVNPSLVYFTANVTAGSNAAWNFGDNTADTGLTVSHLFNGAGPYMVCMSESPDNFITISCTSCSFVNPGNPAGNCSFTYRTDTTNTGMVSFVGIPSSVFGSGIYWDFGDGVVGQGDTVSHVYNANGTYYVCMTEFSGGAVICTSCSYITVGVNSPPSCQAYFVATTLGLSGYFIDLSNTNPATTSYSWNFDDGSGSTSRFPLHTYSQQGAYNVCLTVTDSSNGCTSQYCSQLVVDTTFNNPVFCQAYFVILQLAPYQLAVVNLSNGINLNFSWDFGDGSPVSTQPYPSHVYSSVGSYNLCLTVSDGSGCSNTFCDTVSVDTLGNVFRSLVGFTVNVMSPAQLIGVREISTPQLFAVYPNPVSSALTVSINSDMKSSTTYKVYTPEGVEVTAGTFTRNVNNLNVDGWNAGAYILEVRDAKGAVSYQKIIKQ